MNPTLTKNDETTTNKQKRELQKRINEIRQSLAANKRPLVDTIERIAGEVRREFARQKQELQDAQVQSGSLREMAGKERLDHQNEIDILLVQVHLVKATDRSIRVEKQRGGPKWLVAFPSLSGDIFIVHLHSPRFIAHVVDDPDQIIDRVAADISSTLPYTERVNRNGDTFLALPSTQANLEVCWIDDEPPKDQAEELLRRAGQVLPVRVSGRRSHL